MPSQSGQGAGLLRSWGGSGELETVDFRVVQAALAADVLPVAAADYGSPRKRGQRAVYVAPATDGLFQVLPVSNGE